MTTPASAIETDSNDTAARCVHQLRFARAGLMRVFEGIPQDKLCALPAFRDGGACANHATWLMGHLATTDDWFLKQMGAAESLELSEHWHTIFGGGSTPEADTSKYPNFEELKKAATAQRERLIGWYSQRTSSELAQPSPEKWAKYAPTVADFAFFIAWHEGYHAGQLSVIRKALGLAPAFG